MLIPVRLILRSELALRVGDHLVMDAKGKAAMRTSCVRGGRCRAFAG